MGSGRAEVNTCSCLRGSIRADGESGLIGAELVVRGEIEEGQAQVRERGRWVYSLSGGGLGREWGGCI